jgi:isoquinoline 1-oxidoreductase alpha subunit
MARLNVNGQVREVDVDPEMPLLWALRDALGLMGTKYGCGVAQCGACTVHVDGKAVRSCTLAVGTVESAVTTIEGLGTPDRPHPLQAAFVAEQAAQCGYCTSGIVMAAAALLKEVARPTDAQVRAALDGNLCRCGAHLRVLRAVRRAVRSA